MLAGHGVALDHLGPGSWTSRRKSLMGGWLEPLCLFRADVDVGQQAQPDPASISATYFLMKPFFFQPPHSGAGRGWATGKRGRPTPGCSGGRRAAIRPESLYLSCPALCQTFQPHIFYLGQYYCSTQPLPRHVCNCLPAFPPYNLHPRLGTTSRLYNDLKGADS